MYAIDEQLLALEQELNKLLLAGKPLEAFEQFYAEDIVMQENTDPPVVGKPANRAREQAFFGSIAKFHSIELLGWAIRDNVSYSEWVYEMTLASGARVRMTEVSARRWRDGKIVHERFYYNPS